MVQVSSVVGRAWRMRATIAAGAIAAALAGVAQPAMAAVVIQTTHAAGDPGATLGALDNLGESYETLAVEWTQTIGLSHPTVSVSIVQRAIVNPAVQWTLESVGSDGSPGAAIESGELTNKWLIVGGGHYDFNAHPTTFSLPDLDPGTYMLVLASDAISTGGIDTYWVGAAGSDVVVHDGSDFILDGFYSKTTTGADWRDSTRSYSFSLYGDPVDPAPAPTPTPTPAPAPEPGAWALMLLGLGLAGAALRTRRGTRVASAS